MTYLTRASGILRISVLVFVSFEIVALLILGIRALVKKLRNSQATRAANPGYRSSTGGIVGGITTLILGVICIGGGIYLNYFYDSQRLNMGNYSFDMNENGIYATSKYSWMPPVATVLIILGVVLLGLGIFFLIRRNLSAHPIMVQTASGALQESAAPAPAAVLYCSQCGAQNPCDGKFCKECGALLQKAE